MHVLQLLVQLGVILLCGRLLGFVFRRFGQPGVIAEILAGILLGPSLLGLVSPAAEAMLFPADSLPVLSMLSQLGLVFFMFLVGLEFDPGLLRGTGRSPVAISAAGILVPFALGCLLSLPLHGTLAPEGVPALTFGLFLGTAMSVTAFPVLARILAERRLVRTRLGSITLAAAAVDDVTAWCLLAGVVAIANASGVLPAVRTVGLALAYIFLMWRFVRPMLARVGPRGATQISPDLIAATFLLLFASAGITEWIGIHALFGAFLFGVVVPREHSLAAVLVEKIEDLVTLVLLPLFFAYSGLRTQISLLDSASDWATAGVIVGVATLGKFGGTALAARFTGQPPRAAAAIGILMNTRGLMELVVLNIGLDLGVISPPLFAMMVVMALVTTLATSPLLERIFPASAMIEGDAPAPAPSAPPGLLLCLSDPAKAPALLYVAAAWTQRSRATTWVLHLTGVDRPSESLGSAHAPPAEGPLAELEARARDLGLAVSPISFPSAAPAEDIVRIAQTKRVPLVLLGGHRSPFVDGETLGGVVREVSDARPGCDVGVLVGREAGPVRRVGVIGDAPAVQRVAQRLREEGGVELVPGAIRDVNLVVAPLVAPPPPDVSAPWLLVGGPA